jgi:nucleotide-binding universal stress UspA family protein
MYKKIMVPLDGSKLAECALAHAESIAKSCAAGEVVFVRVVEPVYLPARAIGDSMAITAEDMKEARKGIEANEKAAAKKYLEGVAKRAELGDLKAKTEIVVGKAADALADYAKKKNVDLIIISTHGRSGASRWVWGSVSDRILRSACVPVLMVRAPGCEPGI